MSDKVIDLHTHTNYSDGDLSPMELIGEAIKSNISVLGITDHDTVNGIKNINFNDDLIKETGIKIIKGIELSSKVCKGQMHILGYGINEYGDDLNKRMVELRNNSINSVLSVMEQIKRDYSIMFSYEDIKTLVNANHNLGRPDIAKLCIKYGYASSISEAFDRYLTPAYERCRSMNMKLSYEECIDLILKSGGIPVLAHPKSLKLGKKEFLLLLKDMISAGLQGIEVYHSSHSLDEMKYYESVSKQLNILVSGGSDYHGVSVKPNIQLGSGENDNLHIKKLSILDIIN